MLKGSGNHICENVREVLISCSACHGEGEIPASRFQLSDWMWVTYKDTRKGILDGISRKGCFKDAMKIYRHWKENGQVPCVECGGQGSWYQKI